MQRLRALFVTLVAVLVAVGIQMVHSSSLTSRPSVREELFLHRHLAFLAVALIAGTIAARTDPGFLRRHAGFLFACLVVLLIVVLIPGLGSRINGARRWLRFSGLSVQPSELGRILLPLMTAKQLADCRRQHAPGLRDLLTLAWPPMVVMPLVLVEPDLGATAFLAIGFFLTLFVGGWPLRYFAMLLAFTIPAAMSLIILRPYQLQRVTGFVDAWKDLSQAPWQIRQSLLSFGTGGLHGSGIGEGWQKLSYLPEANTDFVFAVIGEELGLAGTMTICLIWTGVLLVGLNLTRTLVPYSFERTLSTTLLLQLVLQAAVNVAVVTALLPPKGVPHPFISYGGTSLLVSVMATGLILGLSSRAGAQLRPHPDTSED